MSYDKIFSVVNEHTASTVTGRFAISLAQACKAELVLYAANEEGGTEAVQQHTERHLQQLKTAAQALDLAVTLITESGSISRLLPARVQAEKGALVFYPLTPDKRYGFDLQRHAVRHLVKTIKADLAVMRAISLAKPHPGHFLVPLGRIISDKERRFAFIAGLAESFQAKVTLFHVAEEGGAKGIPETISRFGKLLQQEDIKVLLRSGKGDIGKAITVEAITRRNDLIIMGATERGALRSLLFGTPAADVMLQPPCNAILFRAGESP